MRRPRHSNLSPFEPRSSFSSSRLTTFFTGRSSIYFAKYDVLRADDGDCVSDHVAARHLVERGEVRKSRGAQLQAIGLVRAVGDEIDAELALGRFHRRVHLAFRYVQAFGDQLEVVDQLLHA